MCQNDFPTFAQGNLALGMVKLRFGEDFLRYEGQEWAVNVRYDSLPPPSSYASHSRLPIEAKCFTLYTIFLLLCLNWPLGPQYGLDGLKAVLWAIGVPLAILAPVAWLLHWLFAAEYTVIPYYNGDIWILRDRQHDSILDKIQAARIHGLRKLTAPDPANSPDEERDKLRWLRDQEVISDQEYHSLLEFSAKMTLRAT